MHKFWLFVSFTRHVFKWQPYAYWCMQQTYSNTEQFEAFVSSVVCVSNSTDILSSFYWLLSYKLYYIIAVDYVFHTQLHLNWCFGFGLFIFVSFVQICLARNRFDQFDENLLEDFHFHSNYFNYKIIAI